MKKLILIFLTIIAFSNLKAQDSTLTPYTPDGYTVSINVDYVYDQIDNALIDTVKKYLHKGGIYKNKISTEVVRIFGQERAMKLDNYIDTDMQLNYTFMLLNASRSINRNEKSRFLQLMYAKTYTTQVGDTVMGWNDKYRLICGVFTVDDTVNKKHILINSSGQYIDVMYNSMTIATVEEKNNYGF